MENYFNESQKLIGYSPLKETSSKVYQNMGLTSGLEVHQQLKTEKKLFCHCPAGIYQNHGHYQAEIIRHMRPTLSEMGGYDGTALMEFKTKKKIVYHIANETTCTYDIDDTPPFKINQEALNIGLEIALILKTNIVGELHITRKQYLDGSIPAGFQRTAIISIEGEIPLKNKKVGIIQLSLEEDSCREVSDIGHERVYTTDRLGIPLIEVVTYPAMKTPYEVAEAAQYIRYLNRSTGKVRTGIGAAREDVNVSITGGTRIEIKGVSHISNIPELVHNEAFRQKSLLEIRNQLIKKVPDYTDWKISHIVINDDSYEFESKLIKKAVNEDCTVVAVNLPSFKGILSFFTQPGRMFSDEISDRLKVIACIDKPNMLHSEDLNEDTSKDIEYVQSKLNANEDDAQIILWGPKDDIATALDTIEERCKMAFEGIPKETRKALDNGITMFERVLPGADRMYPDTDSAPISISQDLINEINSKLPIDVYKRVEQLNKWNIPEDTFTYLLRNNLVPLIEKISQDFDINPLFIATLLAHRLKHLQGAAKPETEFSYEKIYELFAFVKSNKLELDIIYKMLPLVYINCSAKFEDILEEIKYTKQSSDTIIPLISQQRNSFVKAKTAKSNKAEFKWMMKELSKKAIGNMKLSELADIIRKEGVK